MKILLQDTLYGLVHHEDPDPDIDNEIYQTYVHKDSSYVEVYLIKTNDEKSGENFSLVTEFMHGGCEGTDRGLSKGNIANLRINTRSMNPSRSEGEHEDYYLSQFTRDVATVILMKIRMVKNIFLYDGLKYSRSEEPTDGCKSKTFSLATQVKTRFE